MTQKRQIIVDARRNAPASILEPPDLPRTQEIPAREPLPELLVDEPPPQLKRTVPTQDMSDRHRRRSWKRILLPNRLRLPPFSFRPPKTSGWLLPLLATAAVASGVLLIAANHRSHHRPVTQNHPLSATIRAPHAGAVGMPIPTGDQAVRPIRIVLDVSRHPIPARERRALGEWIAQTQNVATRIRIEDHGRLSPPLTGQRWATSAAYDTTADTALAWLEHGVRHRRAGALVRIGATGSVREARDVRESDVPVSRTSLRIYRDLAADVARQIMVSSRQGYGGTSRSEG